MMTFYGKLISEITNLPSVPSILVKLIVSVDDMKIANKELAQIISFDPSLTAKVLSIANSAAYGSVSRVSNIAFAVTRLGRTEIKNIALTIFMANLVNSLKPTNINLDEFWKHSLATAFIGKKLLNHHLVDNHFDVSNSFNDVYTSGLLHDIGYIMYDVYFPENFGKLLKKSEETEYPVFYIEEQEGKFNHAKEGSNILEYWKLPIEIIHGIRSHHFPEEAPDNIKLIASVINVADYIANMIDFKCFQSKGKYIPSDFAWDKFDLVTMEREELKELFETFLSQSKLFIAFSEMVITS